MTNFNPYVCILKNSTCYKQTTKTKPIGILWHSTGANNPNLKRYVQPIVGDSNYAKDIAKLGKNTYNNDWNHISIQAGVNAFIGKFADGSIGTVQTLPWDYAPWGSGKGSKGSLNKTVVNGQTVSWIQFEICEDGLTDKKYAEKVYQEAIDLTVYLCKKYNIDPAKTITINGVKIPTITCHNDAAKLGFGTSHSDINHWFPKILGKNMNNVREEVTKILSSNNSSGYSKEWVNGVWYNEDGSQTYKPKGKWKQNSKGWWYEDTSGWYPKNEWQKINSKRYYFKEDGYMAENQWIDGYWVGKDGAYDSSKKKTIATASNSYKIKVTVKALNVRASASKTAKINKVVHQGEIYTITKTSGDWGYLSSGAGWIMLKFTSRV